MKRTLILGLWLVFGSVGSLVLPVRATSAWASARTFEGSQKGQKQEYNAEQYAYFTSVTIVPHGNVFDIGGCVNPYHPRGEFFDGEGALGKDGLIHFSWNDTFKEMGHGTIRFIDKGRSVDFRLECSYPQRILRYTSNPDYLNLCTIPSRYVVPLPGEYAEPEAYLYMKSQGGKRVATTAQVHLYPDTNNRLSIKGVGFWGDRDSLYFNFTDEEEDQGRGQIRFVGPARPILIVHYPAPQDEAKEKLAQQFNKRQIPLEMTEDRDK